MKDEYVILDLDGTIARSGERTIFFQTNPRNFRAAEAGVIHDEVIEPVMTILRGLMSQNVEVVVLTARQDSCRTGCEKWLEKVGIPFSEVVLKAKNDMRKDFVAKRELLLDLMEKKGRPLFALEDRVDVAKMMREEGVFVLQVG